MTLRLYDTAARAEREFSPAEPGKPALYLCGATVQAPPHIGHIRSGVNFDILVRWLRASGYRVTFCRNVTDIDDKILRAAAAEGVPWWAVAQRNERAFIRAYDVLGCVPPDVEPRATGHVPEMITLMRRLIGAGHAYAAGGDVYFDVRSWPAYGALSGQRLEHMRPAEDTGTAGAQRDPRDFTLWKGARPGRPPGPAAAVRDALPPAFAAALDGDLAVPQALAVVHDTVRDGNNALATGDTVTTAAALAQVRAMLGVLGLDPLAPEWATAAPDQDLRAVVDALAVVALEQRQAARDRKDYGAADAIRDRLEAAGVFVEDTPDGPRWTVKR